MKRIKLLSNQLKMSGLIGKKIGMTSLYDASGKSVPCTVLEAGPCVVTQVKPVEKDDVLKAVKRAVEFLQNETGENIVMPEKAAEHIAYACGGDVRKALNAVELSVISSMMIDGKREVSLETVMQLTQKSAVKYDREGDEHYDFFEGRRLRSDVLSSWAFS